EICSTAVSKSKTSGEWSPTDPSISTFSIHRREDVERVVSENTLRINASIFNGGHDDSIVLEPISSIHRISNLPPSPQLHSPHDHVDSMTIHPELERPDAHSAYACVSYLEEQRHVVSPPSPSISSMETDVGVDPETGERAME
ncbi:hypothetical protein GDO78_018330, partial [Eleutherodactylus coqui]